VPLGALRSAAAFLNTDDKTDISPSVDINQFCYSDENGNRLVEKMIALPRTGRPIALGFSETESKSDRLRAWARRALRHASEHLVSQSRGGSQAFV
jgi:hypothetical protein